MTCARSVFLVACLPRARACRLPHASFDGLIGDPIGDEDVRAIAASLPRSTHVETIA